MSEETIQVPDLWLNAEEDAALLICGCRLVRSYEGSEDPALWLCARHREDLEGTPQFILEDRENPNELLLRMTSGGLDLLKKIVTYYLEFNEAAGDLEEKLARILGATLTSEEWRSE